MTDAQAITEKRQQIFDENNPIKKRVEPEDDDDDDDELYDESGDEEAVGWSDDSESSITESPRKATKPTTQPTKQPPPPATTEATEASSPQNERGNAMPAPTEPAPVTEPTTQTPQITITNEPASIAAPTADESASVDSTDIPVVQPAVPEERIDPSDEDGYRQTDLFHQLEALKMMRSKKSITHEGGSPKPAAPSPLAQAVKAETEPATSEKQPTVATRKESAPPMISAEKALLQLVKAEEIEHPSAPEEGTSEEVVEAKVREKPSNRVKRADCQTSLTLESNIAIRDGGRPRSGTRSVEVLVPLRSLDNPKPRSQSPNKARHSLQPQVVDDEQGITPANRKRDLESELAIDGAPVLPGADYFYSQADLDMMKEMEARAAMKSAFVQAGAQDLHVKKTNSDIKKKLRVASEMLGRSFKAEEQSTSAADLAERKAQLEAIKKQKEKNHTENLLSESTDLPQSIRLRNLTINEFVKSERDFRLDMQILIDVFCEPLQNSGVITAQQYSTLFSNLSMIYEICCSIVSAMEEAVRDQEHPCLSSCFTQLINCQKMYSDYCNNHNRSSEMAVSLQKKNAHFRQFIEEAQNDPRCGGLQFVSFLIKPVQRICKYHLLLRELIKHETDEEEKEALEEVYENVLMLVNSINETKRAAENMSKIMQIQRKINVKNMELLQPGRSFVKEGLVQDITKPDNPIMVQLYLFNDLLIRAEEKKKKFGVGTMRRNEKLTMSDHAMLYSLKVATLPDQGDRINAFELHFNKNKYLVCAFNAREKQDWLRAIKEQLMNLHSHDSPSKDKLYGSRPDVRGPSRSPNMSHSRSNSTDSNASPTRPEMNADVGSPPTSALSGTKIKCFLHKGTSEQRIRKISMLGLQSLDELFERIRREFEWASTLHLDLSYADEDGDSIEISSSTSIDDVVTEAKYLVILATK